MRAFSFLAVLVLVFAVASCSRKPAAGPVSGWQMSADKQSWAPVELPSTGWKCTNCERFFKTTVEGVPKSVTFRFASDNKARLLVNGTPVFEDFWKVGFCTDKPCCSKCCDSPATCKRIVAEGTTYEVPAAALKAFREGANEVVWEVRQEIGGAGFHVEMNVGR